MLCVHTNTPLSMLNRDELSTIMFIVTTAVVLLHCIVLTCFRSLVAVMAKMYIRLQNCCKCRYPDID